MNFGVKYPSIVCFTKLTSEIFAVSNCQTEFYVLRILVLVPSMFSSTQFQLIFVTKCTMEWLIINKT